MISLRYLRKREKFYLQMSCGFLLICEDPGGLHHILCSRLGPWYLGRISKKKKKKTQKIKSPNLYVPISKRHKKYPNFYAIQLGLE